MKWYEARTLEEFNALPLTEREKMPDYLVSRQSLYDPFKEKKSGHSKVPRAYHNRLHWR